MTVRTLKIISLLLILFSLDKAGFAFAFLRIEFLFIGILIVALNYSIAYSLPFCLMSGVIRDSFSTTLFPIATLTFAFVSILAHHVLRSFHGKWPTKLIIAAVTICAYLMLNNALTASFDPLFSLQFLIISCVVFILLNHLVEQWI